MKADSAPRAAAVVINYKGRDHLEELFASLQHQTFEDFEILFVDNDSKDGSVQWVRENMPQVRLLPQSSNLGFAAAANLAAQKTRAPFLVFLNTDLRLDPRFLEEMIRVADQDEKAAAVASKMRLHSRPDQLNGVGGAMNRLGYTWDRGMFEEDRGQYDDSDEVLFASAGAALFRRQTFLDAGSFDERFFMYHEDVDLCWRFWILGYRVITAPAALVFHHFGGSTQAAKGLAWRERIGERNNMCALLKNYEAANLLRAIWGLLRLKQSPRRKAAQIGNLFWNLVRLPGTLRRRHWIQKRRRRSDAAMRHLIVQSDHVPVRL